MVNRHDFTAYGYVIKEELSTSYYEDDTVYLAYDQDHDRLVVLKVYGFGFATDEADVASKAAQERGILRGFNHPGIPECLHHFVCRDEDNPHVGCIVLVLEHRSGITLEQQFHLTLPQVQSVILQVLDVLACGQSLDPPVFHHAISEGDIVVDYLPQGKVQVSVLNFGKKRDVAPSPKPEEKWRYDLKKLGVIVVRLLSGKVTPDFTLFQKHCYAVSRLPSARFLRSVQQLLDDEKMGCFTDALQAYLAFAAIPVIAPVYPLRHFPYPTLLACFGMSVMLCGVGFGWADLLSLVQGFGQEMTQIPVTVTISFIPGPPLEVNVVYLLAGVLGVLGVLLVIVCLCFMALQGVMIGVTLIVLAGMVMGVYWLIGFVLNLVILLAPIAIAGILILSFYGFMVNCWGQMRQQKFTVSYTLLTMVSGTLAAVAITGDALYVLAWHRHLAFFICLTFTFLPLWLYLLTYPANRYQADVTRQQRAQALVLKG